MTDVTDVTDVAHEALSTIWSAVGGDPAAMARVEFEGNAQLPSAFSVTDLAAASIGAAVLAAVELAGLDSSPVRVDRRLSAAWFLTTIDPVGWQLPPVWDAVAGDYEAADGWIRLHTNAPHHRAAAMRVLGGSEDRDAVARAVATDPARPLAGVRVLDLTRVLAGPIATRFLAGLGADVLRIDPPDWDEPAIIPEVTLGKRCARIDATTTAGRERVAHLMRNADVVVHGYRPEALDRLSLDADARRALCPGIVDVSLDAYGFTGPWRLRRGFDSLVQMSSGIAAAGMDAKAADRPFPLPVQALDHATGYLLATAALRGLHARRTDAVATIARASLARTACLLAALDRRSFDGQGVTLGDDDYEPRVEDTPWGSLRRLRAPVTVPGMPIRWDHGATALGSADAAWT